MSSVLSEGHEIISTKDESIQLFNSKLFDKLSRVQWYVPLIFFLPIIIYFVYSSIVNYNISIVSTFLYFIGGLAVWTVVEYIFHRFIFHYVPKSTRGKKLHFMLHGVHHAYPNDSLRLVMPPAMSIPLATGFYFIFKWFFAFTYAPIFSGFIFGYLAYDMFHYATHHAKFIKARWFESMKNHHMRHHYHDPDNGFGVSSQIWDKVFRTEFKK